MLNRNRTNTHIKIGKTTFDIQQLDADDSRHILKLIARAKVGNCYIDCKYKEFNEKGKKVGDKYSYTAMQYVQTIQIKEIFSNNNIRVYTISTNSRLPQLDSITVNRNGKTYYVKDEELIKFNNLMNVLNMRVDRFVRQFINEALDNVSTQHTLIQTPSNVIDIVKYIEELKSQELDQ